MSELADAIKAAGVSNVANIIKDDPAFKLFNLLWEGQEEIIPACDRMGLNSIQDFVSWLNISTQAIGNIDAFSELIDPHLDIQTKNMASTSWEELHKQIHATGLLAEDCLLHNSDGTYLLPTKDQWIKITSTCPAKRRRHSGNEQLDCDDFVRMALGWLAQKGLGNCASAFAGTRHFFGQNMTGGHAIILVWDSMLTPWQWEPQNGTLYQVTHPKLGGNFMANRLEYARIFA